MPEEAKDTGAEAQVEVTTTTTEEAASTDETAVTQAAEGQDADTKDVASAGEGDDASGAGEGDDEGDGEETLEAIVEAENKRVADLRAASEGKAAEGEAKPEGEAAAAEAAADAKPAEGATADVKVPEIGSLREKWTAQKAEIEKAWSEVDAPGERILVGVIDSLLDTFEPMMTAVAEAQTVAYERAIEAEARSYAASAHQVAQGLNAEFGLQYNAADILGFAQDGGLEAYARLNGKDVMDLRGKVTPEILREVFELKNRKFVDRLRTAPKREASKQGKAPRALTNGGGAAERSKPMTELEQIRADRMEAAAMQKAR